MNNLKKIARMIEKELGYTNGWSISNEEYSAKCHLLASKIVSQIDCRVINAIADYNIFPESPQWNKEIQRLKFSYREYYMGVSFENTFIGYFDCKSVDEIKTKEDFEKICKRFANQFYQLLSNYMSF